jgi:putative copper resistance protein D
LAAEAGEVPIAEAWRDGTAWTFFTDTQFGRVSELRLALAVLIVGSVVVRRRLPSPSGVAASALLGAGFVASLAWCGHAGGGLGLAGTVHMANDAAHLLTAAAWVGGLLPLLLLLGADLEVAPAARHRLVRRFSSVSLMAVAGLILSGLINSWFLLSGMRDLVDTNYGRLILAKAALFLLMLAFAAANRFWLTPSLLPANATTSAGKDALRYLRLSVAMEVALGTAVICVVALLGQLPPPLHMHP